MTPFRGERIDRRTLLRATARAGGALALPAVLGGCKSLIHYLPTALSYPLFVDSLPPGVPGMIAARSAQLGVPANVSQIGSVSERASAFVASGERSASGGSGAFNPVTDNYPRAADCAVVQADASADPGARILIEQGFKVVTFLAPLRYQTAQITVDPAALGSLLAQHAAAWARRNVHGPARALFVTTPIAVPTASGSFYRPPPPLAVSAEDAIRGVFARLLPRVQLTTVAYLEDPVRALRRDARVRIVLFADDNGAAQAARQLRGHRPAIRDGRVYLGALGTPSLGGSQVAPGDIEYGVAAVEQTLNELRRDKLLRAVATVRLRDIATSLVDLPVALLKRQRPYNVSIPPILLTPGSAELATYASDAQR